MGDEQLKHPWFKAPSFLFENVTIWELALNRRKKYTKMRHRNFCWERLLETFRWAIVALLAHSVRSFENVSRTQPHDHTVQAKRGHLFSDDLWEHLSLLPTATPKTQPHLQLLSTSFHSRYSHLQLALPGSFRPFIFFRDPSPLMDSSRLRRCGDDLDTFLPDSGVLALTPAPFVLFTQHQPFFNSFLLLSFVAARGFVFHLYSHLCSSYLSKRQQKIESALHTAVKMLFIWCFSPNKHDWKRLRLAIIS